MALAEDEQVVRAFATHAPQEALARRVGPRGPDGRAQDADPARGGEAVEARPVLTVVVTDEEARTRVKGRRLAQLLGNPGVGRVARHAHVHHAARAEGDDEERVERAEEQVGDRQEVAGPGLAGVVAQEGRPGLPARAW